MTRPRLSRKATWAARRDARTPARRPLCYALPRPNTMLLVALWVPMAAAGMADVVGPLNGMLDSLPHGLKCGSALRWILAFLFGGIFSRVYDFYKAGTNPRGARCCEPPRPKRRVKLETVTCGDCTDDCPICLDPLGSFGASGRLPCGHTFHRDCITRWIDRGCSTCPVCRMDATCVPVERPKLA